MNAVRDRTRMRVAAAGLALAALAGGAASCGSSDAGPGGSDGGGATSTSTTAPAGGSSTTAASSTTGGPTTTAQTSTTAAAGLPDASTAQRSAPGDGTGTALLRAVRVGRNDGFERIVFEFAGSSMPGYRVQWVPGPITADGSGGPVEVTGDAYLEMIMQPASGVDLSAPQLTVVYDGPDRIPVEGQTDVLTDLVRTGDFEAVLSWVAGATEEVPFRVLTLTDPTRIVIDVES